VKVSLVKITNVLGLEELEFQPGAITVVSGKNGAGKTSVLEALKAVCGGGDATLLRNGATTGEVVVVFDDETRAVATIRPDKKPTVTVDHPAFGKLGKSFLADRIDGLAVNPIQFLTAPASKRAEWLLEVLPVEVTDEALQKLGVTDLPPQSRNGLDRLALARKSAYDERTGLNRVAKEKKATATQLRESLFVADPTGENPAKLREELDSLLAWRNEKYTKSKRAAADQLSRARDVVQVEVDAIKVEASRKVEELNANAAKRAEQVQGKLQVDLEGMEAEYTPRFAALAAKLATADEQAKQQAQNERQKAICTQMAAEADAAEAESAIFSTRIEALDALKEQALSKLPIKGVEVREGDIFLDGIPFDRVNRAKQVQFVLNVAKLRAGEIPLVLVDGLECLDDETFAAFEKAAAKSGLQAICSRVTQGNLSVRTA
jgi:recombinational DNA repair ATPase RecF